MVVNISEMCDSEKVIRSRVSSYSNQSESTEVVLKKSFTTYPLSTTDSVGLIENETLSTSTGSTPAVPTVTSEEDENLPIISTEISSKIRNLALTIPELHNSFFVKTLQTYTYLDLDPSTGASLGVAEQHVCFPGCPAQRLRPEWLNKARRSTTSRESGGKGVGSFQSNERDGIVANLSLYETLLPLQNLEKGFFELNEALVAALGVPELMDIMPMYDNGRIPSSVSDHDFSFGDSLANLANSEHVDIVLIFSRVVASALVCRLLYTYNKAEEKREAEKGAKGKGKSRKNGKNSSSYKGNFKSSEATESDVKGHSQWNNSEQNNFKTFSSSWGSGDNVNSSWTSSSWNKNHNIPNSSASYNQESSSDKQLVNQNLSSAAHWGNNTTSGGGGWSNNWYSGGGSSWSSNDWSKQGISEDIKKSHSWGGWNSPKRRKRSRSRGYSKERGQEQSYFWNNDSENDPKRRRQESNEHGTTQFPSKSDEPKTVVAEPNMLQVAATVSGNLNDRTKTLDLWMNRDGERRSLPKSDSAFSRIKMYTRALVFCVNTCRDYLKLNIKEPKSETNGDINPEVTENWATTEDKLSWQTFESFLHTHQLKKYLLDSISLEKKTVDTSTDFTVIRWNKFLCGLDEILNGICLFRADQPEESSIVVNSTLSANSTEICKVSDYSNENTGTDLASTTNTNKISRNGETAGDSTAGSSSSTTAATAVAVLKNATTSSTSIQSSSSHNSQQQPPRNHRWSLFRLWYLLAPQIRKNCQFFVPRFFLVDLASSACTHYSVEKKEYFMIVAEDNHNLTHDLNNSDEDTVSTKLKIFVGQTERFQDHGYNDGQRQGYQFESQLLTNWNHGATHVLTELNFARSGLHCVYSSAPDFVLGSDSSENISNNNNDIIVSDSTSGLGENNVSKDDVKNHENEIQTNLPYTYGTKSVYDVIDNKDTTNFTMQKIHELTRENDFKSLKPTMERFQNTFLSTRNGEKKIAYFGKKKKVHFFSNNL